MLKKTLPKLVIHFLSFISRLPFWALYILSDILYVVLYYVIKYRRKVVQENLKNSFPEKSPEERSAIEKAYFKYLADLIMEIIKSITISEKELKRRVIVTNPELLQSYFAQGKSVIAVSGHYCNWEFAALNFCFNDDKKFLIVYKPLSNQSFDDLFVMIRSRFGGIPVPMNQTMRKMVQLKNEQTVSVLVGDQTPVKGDTNYFTTFLNQPTAVFLGIEKLAVLMDDVVAFYDMKRVARGYYSYTLVPLIDEAKKTAPYEITEAHVRHLEGMITKEPQYWLWSHRRWKYKPESVKPLTSAAY
ncbi:lysophospholipid acyltransferase family protein [Mucilaginibacter sp.]